MLMDDLANLVSASTHYNDTFVFESYFSAIHGLQLKSSYTLQYTQKCATEMGKHASVKLCPQ